MVTLNNLIKRNVKLFFKDKGMLFTSLITPLILLVLYITFLGNVYKSSFTTNIPEFIKIEDSLINGLVGGQLVSSLLSVSCITVAFCSNFLMVQDKVSGVKKDLDITPVKKSTLALSYYISTFISTFVICIIAMLGGFIYLACIGWYLSFGDILFIILDIFLLVLFGTALSSIINYFLTSQGQISAVGTIVSACYGFICGAYMPISQFSPLLQKILSFLPGTYGTSLFRNHCINGVFREMSNNYYSSELIKGFRDTVDCNVYFFGNKVEILPMYLYILLIDIILVGIYVLLNFLNNKNKKNILIAKIYK